MDSQWSYMVDYFKTPLGKYNILEAIDKADDSPIYLCQKVKKLFNMANFKDLYL